MNRETDNELAALISASGRAVVPMPTATRVLTRVIQVGCAGRRCTVNGATSMFNGPSGFTRLEWEDEHGFTGADTSPLQPLQDSVDHARRLGWDVSRYIEKANQSLPIPLK